MRRGTASQPGPSPGPSWALVVGGQRRAGRHVVPSLVGVGAALEEESHAEVQPQADEEPRDGELVHQQGHAAGGHHGDQRGEEPAGDDPDGPADLQVGVAAGEDAVRKPRAHHGGEGHVGGGDGQPAPGGEGDHAGADAGDDRRPQRVVVDLLAALAHRGLGGERSLRRARAAAAAGPAPCTSRAHTRATWSNWLPVFTSARVTRWA